MAVAGVKNVEIPRVANLSPERFHRLEKETMEKGVQNVIFGDLLRDCKRLVLLGQGILHKGETSYHH